MLLFRSEENVNRWCEAKGLPRRPIIDLDQQWHLPKLRRQCARDSIPVHKQVLEHDRKFALAETARAARACSLEV